MMRLASQVEALPGVARAAALMATPANLALLAEAGLAFDGLAGAAPDDLVVALVAAEALKALKRGCHVFLFSDNVPLAEEVALKRLARERGRLVMGPDCGTAIAFISLRPAFQSWEVPWVALVSLMLVLVGWTAGVRLPGNIPAGLAAIIVGTAIGWATGVMNAPAVGDALTQFGLYPPIPSGDVVAGFGNIATLLVTAIPLGIYNFTEGMNNVESAAAAGDDYNLRSILLADGIGAIVGSILGAVRTAPRC